MPDFKRLIALAAVLAAMNIFVHGQLNSNDYWLNHGFNGTGDTIIANSGNFYDDGGFDKYSPGQNWNVNICSENGNPITLDFNNFRTHYLGTVPDNTSQHLNYDYLGVKGSLGNYSVFYNDTPQLSFTDPDGCINIRFVSQPGSPADSGWIAEISANPPPLNNDPCNAALLSVGNACSPSFFTNKGAYDTRKLGSPDCHRFFGGDVWFMAVVPASGQLKIETFKGGLSYAVMVLYRGTCESLSPIECVDNVGGMPSVILNRPAGETIFIRIFGDQAQSGTFGICATDPSVPIVGFTGPGGVGDSISNKIWLKADAGLINNSDNSASDGNNIKLWEDQSGNDNHVGQTDVDRQAVLTQIGINEMPVLTFDGDNDAFSAQVGPVSAPMSIFTVNDFNVSKDQTVISIGDVNNNTTTSISREFDDRYYAFSGAKRFGPTIAGTLPFIIRNGSSVNTPWHSLSINAAAQSVENYAGSLITDGSLHIGSSKDNLDYFDGRLGELIIYNRQLNLAQEIIVNNYLAAKYDIDITSADRYLFNEFHPYDVAGIGRVNAQNIHSKAQSGGILAIGGASDLDDNEFLFFGHDNKDFLSWTTDETPGADPNIRKLAREWRVDNSHGNGVGLVTVSLVADKLPPLPSGFLAYNLMVDEDGDGDFSSGVVTYGLILSGDEYIANNLNIPNGSYIAIAAVMPYVQFDLSTSEGLESFARPEISISLNYAISEPFELSYGVTGGTATGGGVDFSLNDGVLLFNPGQKTNILQPLIIDDNIVEIPDEYFIVSLSNPTAGVQLGDPKSHRYTIIDNDISLEIFTNDTIIGACSLGTQLIGKAQGREPISYSWTPVSELSDPLNDTTIAKPLITTLYTLTVTDVNGNFTSKQINIYVKDLPAKPAITANGPLSFCFGDSVVLTSDSASTYLWSTNETSRSITVKSSGKYALMVFDEFLCSSDPSDSIEVQAYPLPDQPVVTADGNLSFCLGDSVRLTSSESNSYLWSTGETTRSIKVTSEANYYVQVGDVNSCLSPLSETVVVTVHDLPAKPLIQVEKNEICADEFTTLKSPDASSYSWSNGETTQSINVNTSGSYTLVIKNEFGCESEESEPVVITVHDLPSAPLIDVNGDIEFCEGGSTILSSSNPGNYLWSTGETTSSITVNSSGSYTLKISDANNCTSPSSIPVEIIVNDNPEKPVITPPGPLSILAGESNILTSSPADAYLWNNGSSDQQISVNTAGSYSLVAISNKGCRSISSDPVEVSIVDNLPAPEITFVGVTEFCSGDQVELISEPASSYLWSNGETTRSIIVKEPGIFSLVIKNEGGVESLTSETIEVIVNPIPVLEANATNVSCFAGNDGSATVIVTGGHAPYNFSWNNGENSQTINNLNAGEYRISVTDAKNCTSSALASISQPSEIIISENIVQPNCPDAHDGGIVLSVSGGTSPYNYLWDNGSIENSRNDLIPGDYSVRVTDNNNCTKAKDFKLAFVNEICFRIPDIITPNNDGRNDTWKIQGLDLYPNVEVEVYDRSGKRVFYSRGYSHDWDGTSGGKELPMESYHYIINLHNGSKVLIGNVTIVR